MAQRKATKTSKAAKTARSAKITSQKGGPEVVHALKLEFKQVAGNTVLDISASGGVPLNGSPSNHPTRRYPVASFVQFARGAKGGAVELNSSLQFLLTPEEFGE